MHLSGYKGSMFDSGITAMAVVPGSLKTALNILMFILPPLFLALGLLIFVSKYKLANKGKMEEIRAELIKRREAADEVLIED